MPMQISISNAIKGQTLSGGAAPFENLYSFEFDGSVDFIDCGAASNLNFSADDPFSVSAWFKKPSSGSAEAIVSKGLGAPNGNGWLFWVSGNLVYFRIRENSSNFHQIRDNNTHPYNTWVHYVATYDGSRTGSGGGLNLYRNGLKLGGSAVQKSGNFPSGTGQSTANVGIGARNPSSFSLPFGGKIDEVAVWDSELSQPDVTAIYNLGVPDDLNNSGLSRVPLSWWRMGENATWTGRDWNPIADVNGGNNGYSATMPFAARTTDVPT